MLLQQLPFTFVLEMFSDLQEIISISHTSALPKIDESITFPQHKCVSITT